MAHCRNAVGIVKYLSNLDVLVQKPRSFIPPRTLLARVDTLVSHILSINTLSSIDILRRHGCIGSASDHRARIMRKASPRRNKLRGYRGGVADTAELQPLLSHGGHWHVRMLRLPTLSAWEQMSTQVIDSEVCGSGIAGIEF